MKKKVIAILLSMAMVCSVAACSTAPKKEAKISEKAAKESKEKEQGPTAADMGGILQKADVAPMTINGVEFEQADIMVSDLYRAITGHEIKKDWQAITLKPGEGAVFTANDKKGNMIASIQAVNTTDKELSSDQAKVGNMTLIGKADGSSLTYDICGLTNTTKGSKEAKKVMKGYKIKDDKSNNSVKWYFGIDPKRAKTEKKETTAQNELSIVFVDSGKKQQNWLSVYFPTEE